MSGNFDDRALAAAIEASLVEAQSQKDLERALAISTGDTQMPVHFRLMFLGGSPDVDPGRRMRFGQYGCFTAGSHEDADIMGDWNSPEFWAKIEQADPSAIVIDSGSESWLLDGSPAVKQLVLYVKRTNVILMYSPHHASPWLYKLYTQHYNTVMYENQYLLFTFSSGLPERTEPRPSELVWQIQECQHGRLSAKERAACYESLKMFGNVASFEDAVEQQLNVILT